MFLTSLVYLCLQLGGYFACHSFFPPTQHATAALLFCSFQTFSECFTHCLGLPHEQSPQSIQLADFVLRICHCCTHSLLYLNVIVITPAKLHNIFRFHKYRRYICAMCGFTHRPNLAQCQLFDRFCDKVSFPNLCRSDSFSPNVKQVGFSRFYAIFATHCQSNTYKHLRFHKAKNTLFLASCRYSVNTLDAWQHGA